MDWEDKARYPLQSHGLAGVLAVDLKTAAIGKLRSIDMSQGSGHRSGARALLLVGAGPHFETPGHSYANMLEPPTVFFASSQLFALFVGVLVLVLAQGFRVRVGYTVSYPV